MPDGLEVLVSKYFNTTIDENGDILLYPEGDLSAAPSGRMPRDGFFFDTIIRQDPIDDNKLDPEDNLEEFGPVTDQDLDYFREEIQKAEGTGKAVIVTFGGMAYGDIALVPAPFLKHPKGIRDIKKSIPGVAPNLSLYRRKVGRKLKKYYPAVISPNLLFKEDAYYKSKVFEWLVVGQLSAEFFWRDPYKNEVDVIKSEKEIIPIEIKYGRIEYNGLLAFMRKFKVQEGYVLSFDTEKTQDINGKPIHIIPAFKFLLEQEKYL